MKIKIIALLMGLLPLLIKAQVTVTSQIPATGILLRENLWNMILVNNNTDIANLKLVLDVRDITTGQSVMNAGSGTIMLANGMKVITNKEIQPVLYNYLSNEFSGSYLPCGSYIVNIQVLQETNKGEIPVASESVRINVAPLSPPLLSNPENHAVINTVYPQFAWMPPTPLQMFNPLLYDITVVEIQEGQHAKEAMLYNNPVYTNTAISYPAEKMPTSFSALEQGKLYAWQIVAHSGYSCSIASDIWQFSIGKDSVAKMIQDAPYIQLSKSSTEVTVAQDGILKMEYSNTTGDKRITCTVYKAGNKNVKDDLKIQFNLDLVAGKNLLQYDTKRKIKLDENSIYECVLTNSQGEEWSMKFTPVYHNK